MSVHPGRRRPVFRRRVTTLAAAASLTVGLVGVAGVSAAAPVSASSFPGSVPSWATRSADAGAAAADQTVEGEVFLPLRNQQGAQALALAVSTPGNPKYGKFLTPTQWINTYSPTVADFNAVKHYLLASGLKINGIPASRQYIVFRAPVSAIAAAFKTSIHNYRYSGKIETAPDSAPKLPAAIAGKVSAVSLDSSRLMTAPTHVQLDGSTRTATPKTGAAFTPKAKTTAVPPVNYPCDYYYGESYSTTPSAYGKTSYPGYICGYLPDQLRSGYNLNKLINAGNDGTGQTVAIIDAYASKSIVQDTNDYMRMVGSPLLLTYKQVVPSPKDYVDVDACGGASGWNLEQTLDVQSSHSIAPGANILYVGGFNCGGGLDIALSKVLDNKLSTIVSNSYSDLGEGVPGAIVTGEEALHIQAAAEGIGLYFATGDSGDETSELGYVSANYPTTSPFVTAVGGTSLAVGANGAELFQTGWGATRDQILQSSTGKLSFAEKLPGTFRSGGGGGTSTLFAQPAYQRGIVPAKLADAVDGTPSRVIPDISALGDPYTGFQIGIRELDDATGQLLPFGFETYGGTSLSTPIVAAEAALTQQAARRPIGFANPLLYRLDKTNPSVFEDVVPPKVTKAVAFTSSATGFSFLVTFDRDSSLKTAKGYDNVTGIGTPRVSAFASLLKSLRR